MNQLQKQQKLDSLCEIEGYEDDLDMLLQRGNDSCVPAICSNDDCNYTCEMEPDQSSGYCEECKTQTMVSFMILMDII